MKTVRLAPLAGVTDWPFRILCFEQGCDSAYTEMVSAMGYLYAPKAQQELVRVQDGELVFDEAWRAGNGGVRFANEQLLIRHPKEKKLILQLFGKEPDVMARAAAELAATGRYEGIDINMGCPAPKIACAGEGSGLMRTPELAGQIMQAVVRATELPVSVKLRLGWDHESINVLDMAKRAEAAGVKEITVHGRTRMQQYGGVADWTMIEQVKRSVSVPVIGNGDIFTAEDGVRRIRESGVDGVMIARGAMGNPWLFGQIKALLSGETMPTPTLEERIETILRHYRMLLEWKPERIAVREMRKHIAWYLHGLRGAAQMRVRINTIETPQEAEEALRDYAAACAVQES